MRDLSDNGINRMGYHILSVKEKKRWLVDEEMSVRLGMRDSLSDRWWVG